MSVQETTRPTFPTIDPPPFSNLTYGLPFYDAAAKQIKEHFGAQRPYIIASNTLSKKTKFLEQLQQAIGSTLVGTWIGIPNHTPVDSLIPIIENIRAKDADIIITLGGGSISDGAKLISFALANNIKSAEELPRLPHLDADVTPLIGDDILPPKIPVICIPISLSGGEYSCYAGVIDPRTHHKDQYTHPKMYPSLIILDPTLTLSTPLPLWLSTGVRSIDHCVEGYLSINSTPEGDKASLEALPLLIKGLLKTKDDPTNLPARLQCQLGSNLSLTLLHLAILKGASHGIGHQLGPLASIPHGDTSCILLPAVCKYNAIVNGPKQESLKQFLINELPIIHPILEHAGQYSLSPDGKSTPNVDLGDILRAFFDHLGMPRSLKDIGFTTKQNLEELAELCMDEVFVKSNPRPLKTPKDVVRLLELVG